MPTVSIDPWVNTVLGRLNGAEREMVKTEVQNTIRDFFAESTVWRVDLLLDTRAGQFTYKLDGLVPNTDVLYVHSAHHFERPLNPIEPLPFDRNYTGDPHQYWSPSPGEIRISPIPGKTEADALRLRVSLRPVPGSCQVPDWIEKAFFGVILDGILARMYLHMKRPYTSPTLGERHSRLYQKGIVRARSMGSRRFTPADHAFSYPQGWSPII